MPTVLCRICAKESCNVLQLFEREQKSLILKIKDLTGLLLKNHSGIPENICSSCRNAINDAHSLRQNILKVQSQFEEMCNKSELQAEESDSELLQLDIKEEDELENVVLNPYQPVAIYQLEYEFNSSVELKHSDDKDVLKQTDEDNGNITDEEYKDQRNTKEISSDENSEVKDDAKQDRRSKSVKRKQYEKNHNDDEDNLEDFNTNIFKCNYDQCAYMTGTRQRLKVHYQRHIGIKEFSCGHCIKKFHRKSELAKHMPVHTGEKPYECKICQRRFANSSTKYQHELIHTNKRPYLCSECGRAFRMSGLLKLHMRTHTGERNFKCDLCKRSFSQKQHLTRHYNSVMHKEALQKNQDPKFIMPVISSNRKTYECKYCHRCFDDSTRKNDHERIHTNERPHLCSQCGKAFRIAGLLKLHMHTHTGERNFKCEICKKYFAKGQHLTRHYQSIFHKKSVEKVKESDEIPEHLMKSMLILKGVNKYKCELCKQSFPHRYHLGRHNLTAKHKEALEKVEKSENKTESLSQLAEFPQSQNEQLPSTPQFGTFLV